MRAAAVLLGCLLVAGPAAAQASEGSLSDREIESLRETANVPLERVAAYQKILDEREEAIEALLAKPRRPGFNADMHDAMEQFGEIADELNDNLDEYRAKRRDIRKALPKLLAATERWATTVRAPVEDDHYKVSRRIALTALKDMHDLVVSLKEEQDAYFKEHPEAAKAEKERQ